MKDEQTRHSGGDTTVLGDQSRSRAALASLPSFPQRYVVLDVLGRGGMGTVYRAYDKVLSREVAVKRLHVDLSAEDGRRRLEREARAMAQLNHENVVTVHDVLVGTEPLVVMEFIRGPTLRQWLEGRRSGDEVLAAFLQAGRGLAAAHGAGLVHLDFKPSNVLVGAESIKVTDFGLARPAGRAAERPGSGAGQAEHDDAASQIVGTPRYMAPEQYGGGGDARSDQYAFALTLAEALGRPFIPTLETPELARLKRGGLQLDGLGLPRRVVGPLSRALEPEPSQRFGSMDELLGALEWRRSARRRTRVALVAVLGIGLAGAVGVAVGARTAEPEPILCDGGAAQMSPIWSAEIRERVQDRLPSGFGSRELVLDAFDRFAAQWVDANEDGCQDTLIRHQQSERGMDVRMACLNEARTEFAVVVGEAAELGERMAAEGPKLAQSLPDLERCADPKRLGNLYPDEPELAASVAKVRDDLVAVRTAVRASNPERADALSRRALTEAQSLGFEPLIAECTHGRAVVAAHRQDHGRALELNYAALELAIGVGHDDLAAVVLLAVVFQELEAGNTSTASRMGQLATAATKPGTAQRGMSLVNRSAVALTVDEVDAAHALLESAQRTFEETWAPDDPRFATLLTNLGVVEERRANFEGALSYYQRAERATRPAYGSGHPLAVRTRLYQANALRFLGRSSQALRLRLAVAADARRAFPVGTASRNEFESQLGANMVVAGEHDSARATLGSLLEADQLDVRTNAALYLALIALRSGEPDALATAEDVLDLCDGGEACDPYPQGLIRTEVAIRRGRVDGAAVAWYADLASRRCPIEAGIPVGTMLSMAGDPRADRVWRDILGCESTDHAARKRLELEVE